VEVVVVLFAAASAALVGSSAIARGSDIHRHTSTIEQHCEKTKKLLKILTREIMDCTSDFKTIRHRSDLASASGLCSIVFWQKIDGGSQALPGT
jgi:hypothetical protein